MCPIDDLKLFPCSHKKLEKVALEIATSVHNWPAARHLEAISLGAEASRLRESGVCVG